MLPLPLLLLTLLRCQPDACVRQLLLLHFEYLTHAIKLRLKLGLSMAGAAYPGIQPVQGRLQILPIAKTETEAEHQQSDDGKGSQQ